MSSKYLLGFDIGGTKIGIGLGTVDGTILQSERIDNKNTDPEKILPLLAEIAKKQLAAEKITSKDVLAFGISTPSPADIPNGIITNPPNNPYWRNVPLKSYLENALQIKGCFENDANCAALAEWYFGAGKGCKDMIYLTMSTGIGAGIIAGGKLIQGTSFLAGEIGHAVLVPNGRLCNCGLKGCWEAYCGGRAIAQRMQEELAGTGDHIMLKYAKDGLLENLDGWVFVEWSKANDSSFLQGVNYPTNMMYAKALESFGKMYAEEKYILRAEVIRKKIREDSFNGRFFEDNRIRVQDEWKRTGNMSETCQYYAFFTGVATPELYPELFQLLVEKFGPGRQETECYPFVYKSNAFIGNYLRLMILAENGETMRLAKECIGYFYNMTQKTGTLWEHNDISASLNHGFASYVAVLLVRYMSGYKGRKGNCLKFSRIMSSMDCRLTLPLGNGTLEYVRKDGKVQVRVPQGYYVEEDE